MDFVTFMHQLLIWFIVIFVIGSLFFIYGDDTGNFYKKKLKESVKSQDYEFLLDQIKCSRNTGLYAFITSNLLSIYIVLIAYSVYSYNFFFGLNYVFAGIFFFSAIAVKAGISNSWKNVKSELKDVLRDEDILIEDLVKDVQDWKVNN